jgi:hypothetical protein
VAFILIPVCQEKPIDEALGIWYNTLKKSCQWIA